MPDNGANSSTRTPRKRALEIGTDSSKFPADPPIPHEQGGKYRDNADAARPVDAPLPPGPNPFGSGK